MKVYPLFFTADFKERVWGGQKIKEIFNKEIPYEHTGESWEVASHPNGHSIIKNGSLKDLTLEEVTKKYGEEILGYTLKKGEKFPLLLKIIDAKDKLSVQVHPNDDYANREENGELGKSEAWYVLYAKEGAKLVAGLKDGVTKEDFVKALEEERVEETLNQVSVKTGDVIDIPAGFVHAIGSDLLIAEIQQNSDTTYRVYDWMRLGLDGKPRELHVSKSLDVIDFAGEIPKELVKGEMSAYNGYTRTAYIKNEFFEFEKLQIESSYKVENRKEQFEIFMCIEGSGEIIWENERYPIVKGDSFMIPANLAKYSIEGGLTMLRSVEGR